MSSLIKGLKGFCINTLVALLQIVITILELLGSMIRKLKTWQIGKQLGKFAKHLGKGLLLIVLLPPITIVSYTWNFLFGSKRKKYSKNIPLWERGVVRPILKYLGISLGILLPILLVLGVILYLSRLMYSL